MLMGLRPVALKKRLQSIRFRRSSCTHRSTLYSPQISIFYHAREGSASINIALI